MEITRNLDSVRLMMHGSSRPDAVINDMFCYDINHARSGCRKGIALYVSMSVTHRGETCFILKRWIGATSQ